MTALHDCWLFSISSHKWGDDVSKNKSISDFHLAFPFVDWKITVIEVVQNLANYFELFSNYFSGKNLGFELFANWKKFKNVKEFLP